LEKLVFLIIARIKRMWHIDCSIYRWESEAERVLDCEL